MERADTDSRQFLSPSQLPSGWGWSGRRPRTGEFTPAGGCLLQGALVSSKTYSSRAASFLPLTSDEIISMKFYASG